MDKLSPVKLSPAFKDYIWGGTKLKTQYNKNSDLEIISESWELSAHPDGESKVLGGEFDGMTLGEYINACGRDILGSHCEKFDRFPLLIKLIDARDNLSVQVHPEDTYALENEGEYGKTEMWYILDCEEGAALYYGFKRDISREEYKDAIEKGTLTRLLNRVSVRKGDVFFIPAGTVHAIGSGILICEIQQNSNTTYRVYDYGRKDKNGNTRPLHIEKAAEVSSLKKMPPPAPVPEGEDVLLARCEYFTVRRLRIKGSRKVPIDGSSFHSLIVTEGSGSLETDGSSGGIPNFVKGDSIFVPAGGGAYILSGECELILSYV